MGGDGSDGDFNSLSSLLLSLGLIVALVVVSNRSPAGQMVKKTKQGKTQHMKTQTPGVE